MKTPNQRKGTEAQSQEGSVLQIGLQYFWFESHEKAAQAFTLLSKATHVHKQYRGRTRGPESDYTPQELIGDISVKMVPRSALRLSDSALKEKGES